MIVVASWEGFKCGGHFDTTGFIHVFKQELCRQNEVWGRVDVYNAICKPNGNKRLGRCELHNPSTTD
jgi:hypothetical protein